MNLLGLVALSPALHAETQGPLPGPPHFQCPADFILPEAPKDDHALAPQGLCQLLL